MKTSGTSALKQGERYTLKQWRTFPIDEQWELIDGIPYAMSPAPRLRHQRLLLDLATQLKNQLQGKPCEPFMAPVDLFPIDGEETVVQPDLMIVCNEDKCREEGIFGPPDWILEILSPSTSYKDQTEKRFLYERAGVREYWILNPESLDLLIYRIDGKTFSDPKGSRLDRKQFLGILPEIGLVAPGKE